MNSIKKIRESMELTQVEFSQLLGITQGALSSLETGRKEPSLKMLKKIKTLAKKRRISVTYDDLLGD